jgi:hypothetical protein
VENVVTSVTIEEFEIINGLRGVYIVV